MVRIISEWIIKGLLSQLKTINMDWLLFYSELTGTIYCWNGKYPVKITPEPQGEMWHPEAIVTDEEQRVFNAVMSSHKRMFTVKGRDRFKVMMRGLFINLNDTGNEDNNKV